MKKAIKIILPILLVCLAAFVIIFVCVQKRKNDRQPEDTSAGDNTVSCFPYRDYVIVRPESCSESLIKRCGNLFSAIKETGGYSIGIVSDAKESQEGKKELLLGLCNRLDSRENVDRLRYNSFGIRLCENGNIVIVAHTDEALFRGVDFFLANCISEKGFALPEHYDYMDNSTYTADVMQIGGTDIGEFVIVTENAEDENAKIMANGIRNLIRNAVGFDIPVQASSDSAHRIVIRNTDAVRSYGISADGETFTVAYSDKTSARLAYEELVRILTPEERRIEVSAMEESRTYPTKERMLEQDSLIVYPEYDSRIVRSNDYGVSVTQNGVTKDLTVYDHTEYELMLRRTYNGDMHRRFCEFAFSGSGVRVDITVRTDVSEYAVFPSTAALRTEMTGNVISVYLDQPQYFMLQLNRDYDTILSVFADEPEAEEDIPWSIDPSVIYIDGFYAPSAGNLVLGGDIRELYIPAGSVLCARITVSADRVKISGRGAVIDPYANITGHDVSKVVQQRMLVIKGDSATVEGIKLLDARDYNIDLNCNDARIRNVKILCTMTCSDGISFRGGKNCVAENCLIYNGDNSIVMGGGDGHIVRNCILGTTCAPIYLQDTFGLNEQVVFSDIDIFRCDEAVINYAYNDRKNDCKCDVLIRNVSAVDAHNTVFAVGVKSVKGGEKKIRIENFAVNTCRGTDAIYDKNPSGREIEILNTATDVKLTMVNFYVNGILQTKTDEKKHFIQSGSTNSVIVFESNADDAPEFTVTPVSTTVQYLERYKIFVGARRIVTKVQPLLSDGTVYLPYEELAAFLPGVSEDDCVDLNGVRYLSAEKAGAEYSESEGKLTLQSSADGINLLGADGGYYSVWNENTSYETHLSANTQIGDSRIYTLNCYTSGKGGMQTVITEALQQYAGSDSVLTLTFDAKLGDSMYDDVYKIYVSLCVNGTVQKRIANITPEWRRFTIEFDMSNMNIETVRMAYLGFSNNYPQTAEILFANLALTVR